MQALPLRRVVITGMGAISPLGVGAAALWQGLREGRSA
ncbi:MAG: beta-ketoacyl synthase N-terminal-like domain-containing protein, partial [Rhodanobacter lindaniclasticus]